MEQASRTRQRPSITTTRFYQTLGKTLRTARERKNIQPAELAAHLRLHPLILRLIEEGMVEVSAATVHILCCFYDDSIEAVFTKIENQTAALDVGDIPRSDADIPLAERLISRADHADDANGSSGANGANDMVERDRDPVETVGLVGSVGEHRVSGLVPEEELEQLIALLERLNKTSSYAFMRRLLQTIVTRT